MHCTTAEAIRFPGDGKQDVYIVRRSLCYTENTRYCNNKRNKRQQRERVTEVRQRMLLVRLHIIYDVRTRDTKYNNVIIVWRKQRRRHS